MEGVVAIRKAGRSAAGGGGGYTCMKGWRFLSCPLQDTAGECTAVFLQGTTPGPGRAGCLRRHRCRCLLPHVRPLPFLPSRPPLPLCAPGGAQQLVPGGAAGRVQLNKPAGKIAVAASPPLLPPRCHCFVVVVVVVVGGGGGGGDGSWCIAAAAPAATAATPKAATPAACGCRRCCCCRRLSTGCTLSAFRASCTVAVPPRCHRSRRRCRFLTTACLPSSCLLPAGAVPPRRGFGGHGLRRAGAQSTILGCL